jgi:uncharacterized protein (DUF2252 family)
VDFARKVVGVGSVGTRDLVVLMMGRDDGDPHYYVRQLHDMKGAIPVERVRPAGLSLYAGLCGWTLARAHARTGDRLAIAAYLGRNDRFVTAVTRFAESYADQSERDYELLTKAIRQGRVKAETGV